MPRMFEHSNIMTLFLLVQLVLRIFMKCFERTANIQMEEGISETMYRLVQFTLLDSVGVWKGEEKHLFKAMLKFQR